MNGVNKVRVAMTVAITSPLFGLPLVGLVSSFTLLAYYVTYAGVVRLVPLLSEFTLPV
jgi:hypothetical protein